jgi:hypothetical protein
MTEYPRPAGQARILRENLLDQAAIGTSATGE